MIRTEYHKEATGVSINRTLAGLLLCALMVASIGGAGRSVRAETVTHTETLDRGLLPSFPSVLGSDDTNLYRAIFALQENGHWKQADALVARLENDILLGHVLEQRYMHPKKYRSSYTELKRWLDNYADHPQSVRVYKLAKKRRLKGYKAPKRPDLPKNTVTRVTNGAMAIPYRKLSSANRARVRSLRRTIGRHIAFGRTLAAKRLLKSKKVKTLFSKEQYDESAAKLGFRYFIDGRDEWALAWAGEAYDRSGNLVSEGGWAAGLASWRMGDMEMAAHYFSAVASSAISSRWLTSAAGFWAARAYIRLVQPQKALTMLRLAGDSPTTFYGLLANHVLGEPTNFTWKPEPFDHQVGEKLLGVKRGRRAMALLQIGENRRAEQELRYAAQGSDDVDLLSGLMSLSTWVDLPSLSLRLSERLASLNEADVTAHDAWNYASYPIPSWTPTSGFSIDPALLYAFIRQESRFNPEARSRAGARGIMQLMPNTAQFVARRTRTKINTRAHLYHPQLNITLGQDYIKMLHDEPGITGNLITLIVAWNGGPGNLRKWKKTMNFQEDPLLFMETIPARETRIFVERVLANLWIYRDRLGQDAPSLAQLAQGKWPVYVPVNTVLVESVEKLKP